MRQKNRKLYFKTGYNEQIDAVVKYQKKLEAVYLVQYLMKMDYL